MDKDAIIEQLIRERDDADRRAGAAERMLEYERSASAARAQWLSMAKRQWGVSDNVSFDEVWKEALALRARSEQLLAGARINDDEVESKIKSGWA